MELSEEAKAEIAEAVRIVREDRMDTFIRDRMGHHGGPAPVPEPEPDPQPEPEPEPDPTGGPAPKGKTPPPKPPTPEPEKRASLWGNYAE